MPMGMADVATVLFEKHLKFSARNPKWPDRDRFVLSAGHGSMLLYALLFLTGYEDIQLKDLKNFRQLNSKTAGHPEYGYLAGIETTTGPLGQGLATAVGLAIAESSLSSKWGKNIFNHYTYVVAGDGCLMEGISQEAISLAGKLKLNKLIVFWDNNGITIDGELSKSCITDQKNRFLASGWAVFECDGHDPKSIDLAIIAAKNQTKPSIIACKTHIGFGSPKKQDSAAAHGSPLGEEEILAVKKNLWLE
jgi:transketolase